MCCISVAPNLGFDTVGLFRVVKYNVKLCCKKEKLQVFDKIQQVCSYNVRSN